MRTSLITALTVFVLSFAVFSQPVASDSIRFTAVGAPWWVAVDTAGLEVKSVGTKADGAYFLLYPTKDNLNISVYVEPAAKCKTSEACRDFVLTAGNPAWGKFEALNKATFGKFSYFEFFRPQVMERPLQMQDMYAQYVDSGYWVDLHLSKVQYKKEDKELFEKLLGSVRFVPKKEKFESAIEKVVLTGNTWLEIWDQQKCAESYRALTSISRDAVKESLWIEYCKSAHFGLGKLRSRELIAITTTRSLPPKPDRSGAVLRFQSAFENRETVEFVSLTSEKDGSWTVSNYSTQ